MSTIQYALRANSFGYDDKYYHLYDSHETGRVCGVYNDFDSAMLGWKKLEYQILGERPLFNIANFFELSEEKLRELDSFVFERCGEHIVEKFNNQVDYIIEDCENIIRKMNLDQVFEFVNNAGICSYKLTESTKETKFYVCWLPEKAKYYFSNNYGMDEIYSVCHATSVDALLDHYYHSVTNYGSYEITINGALHDISHNPKILQTLLAVDQAIQYDEKRQILIIGNSYAFKQVYPLLLNPPCKVRDVTLEQLYEIQQKG